MSNFIKRDLADKAAKHGSKLERPLGRFEQDAEREAPEAEQREEARGPEPAPRGLPPGFGFRRRTNH